MTDLKPRILSKVAELVAIANRRYGTMLAVPPVFFDCHGLRAGFHKGGTIHFNSILLRENTEAYFTSTVPHEVAHYVQWHVYPQSLSPSLQHNRRVHGHEWKSIMRLFGVRPERTHNFDVTTTRRRIFQRFPLYCGCPNVHIYVTLKLVNKMRAGKMYTCRTCHQPVSLTKPLTPGKKPVN